jgi:hypothetical protein
MDEAEGVAEMDDDFVVDNNCDIPMPVHLRVMDLPSGRRLVLVNERGELIGNQRGLALRDSLDEGILVSVDFVLDPADAYFGELLSNVPPL